MAKFAVTTPTRIAYTWRAMTPHDIDGVVAVARTAFPDHYEPRACFVERLRLFAPGCFVLVGDGTIAGYLIAYPWPLGAVPPLGTLIGALPTGREVFYLHDLALLPSTRGQGYARAIVDDAAIRLRALGGRTIALVSVNSSVPFWTALGFTPVNDPSLAGKLATYGPDAAYMTRAI